VKPLRYQDDFPQTEDVARPVACVVGPATGVIKHDIVFGYTKLHGEVFHCSWFVVIYMAVIAAHQYFGDLPGVVKSSRAGNAIAQDRAGRTIVP